MIVGKAGTGKTTLANAFVEKYGKQFTGGVYWSNVPSMKFGTIDLLDEEIKPSRMPSLVILEELGHLNEKEFTKTVTRILTKSPLAQMLGTSQERKHYDLIDCTVEVGYLNRKEFDALFRLGLNLSAGIVAGMYNEIGGNPITMGVLSNLIIENLFTADQLLYYAKPFKRSGILGPDGKPIEVGDKSYTKIISTISVVNRQFLNKIAENPSLMYDLSPRQFEKIVAELLESKGYEVKISPATRDGGVDIYAAEKNDLGSFLYLVQCKRYAPEHHVGVGLIRELLGTVELKRATAGILVTSSFFSKDAKELQQQLAYKIGLKDYFGIQKWIKDSSLK
jgi:restriction system protein